MSGGANALVPDIVLMKAQYGVSASASSDVVNAWVEASGNWANPGASDIGRIKAVRVVIVARSKEHGNGEVTAASCTNGSGIVNTGPCTFDDAQAPVIDLSGVSVPSGASWRQFRYRVHQAVIPLRNVIWGT
jgi:type IV pilus assembly protein PilW